MKRLLTGTALLTICIPMMAYAAGTDNAAPTMTTPMAPAGASRTQVAPEGADSTLSSDTITQSNGVSLISSEALSAYYLKGADVLGSDNKKLGTIDDIVFNKTGHAERALIAAGGVAGIGAKEVAVNFSDLTFTGQDVKKPIAQVNATVDGLKSHPAVNKDKIGSGMVLASSLVGAEVKLQESDDKGKISDLILDKKGAAKFVAIDFGGILGVGDKRVAVSYDKLGPVVADKPIMLRETKAKLQAAPAFVYTADESTSSIIAPKDTSPTAPRE